MATSAGPAAGWNGRRAVVGTILDGLSWALLLAGAFFIVTGGVGLIRLPDVYTRMHAAGVTDTLGIAFYIAGMMIQGGFTLVTVKLLMILIFILFTGPTATYALANAAFAGGVHPRRRDGSRCDTRDRGGKSSKT